MVIKNILILTSGKLLLRSKNKGSSVGGSFPKKALNRSEFFSVHTLFWRERSNPTKERPRERISVWVRVAFFCCLFLHVWSLIISSNTAFISGFCISRRIDLIFVMSWFKERELLVTTAALVNWRNPGGTAWTSSLISFVNHDRNELMCLDWVWCV